MGRVKLSKLWFLCGMSGGNEGYLGYLQVLVGCSLSRRTSALSLSVHLFVRCVFLLAAVVVVVFVISNFLCLIISISAFCRSNLPVCNSIIISRRWLTSARLSHGVWISIAGISSIVFFLSIGLMLEILN